MCEHSLCHIPSAAAAASLGGAHVITATGTATGTAHAAQVASPWRELPLRMISVWSYPAVELQLTEVHVRTPAFVPHPVARGEPWGGSLVGTATASLPLRMLSHCAIAIVLFKIVLAGWRGHVH